MANFLFNKKHICEYASYGGAAGLLHVFTVWLYLNSSANDTSAVLISGSVFFMFTIMAYALKLTKRKPENYSTWEMIIAGQLTVVFGVVVAVLGAFILCAIYLADYWNDRIPQVTEEDNVINSIIVELIFSTATIENYIAGAFISAMISYAVKPNQTEDKTPTIFEEPAEQ